MFSSLTEKFTTSFNKLKGRIGITKFDLTKLLEELRNSLIDADVQISVVDELIEQVKLKFDEEKVSTKHSPLIFATEIVKKEIIKILGETFVEVSFKEKKPDIYFMIGLQGVGKTTSTIKLAKYLEEKKGKKVKVTSVDIYRPAAIEQLNKFASSNNIDYFFDENNCTKVKYMVDAAIKDAKNSGVEVLIIDTAGRLQIDANLIQELKDMKSIAKPVETFLVIDAMTGQVAVEVAKTFNDKIGVSGIIVTKMEGDAKGGAALSVAKVTSAPIKFIGIGEKVSNFIEFYPERIANRIMGLGDMDSLFEQASLELGGKSEIQKLESKVKKGTFNFNDLAAQLRMVTKIGGIINVVRMLPGMSAMQLPQNLEKTLINRNLAIISSMTKKERLFPRIINSSCKVRIANGSGTTVNDINVLLKQFEQASKLASKVANNGLSSLGSDSDLMEILQNGASSIGRDKSKRKNKKKK